MVSLTSSSFYAIGVVDDMDLSNRKLNLQRAATHVHKPGYKFPVEKRIEVVTKWMALGNMRLVAELTGVSYQLCRMWKQQPWWKELEAEIRASRNIQTNNKLSKLVDRSLDMIADRLENGDFVFNQKTGEVVRKEVSLRDVNVVAKDLMTQQINLQKQEKEETVTQNQVSIQDQLKLLAQEFAKFNGKNTGPVSDAVIIQETTNAEFQGVVEQTGEPGEDEDFSFEMEGEESELQESSRP